MEQDTKSLNSQATFSFDDKAKTDLLAAMPQEWINHLCKEFEEPYFQKLTAKIAEEKEQGVPIFPPIRDVFRAFQLTSFNDIRVVILGQDPYHGEGQAMGLSFSVPRGVKIPPSLKNMYKEIFGDGNLPTHGDLTCWAEQGVFLLNTALTVQAAKAGSHSKFGWHHFTDSVIRLIAENRKNIVFMLWGNHAIGKTSLIDEERHLVLTAPHPSPLSAHRGFLGCGHFLKANDYLVEHGRQPIHWPVN